ncbi:MAG: hypothetical protein LBP25_04015, partial [Tannerellaceae bacterium]|nr:hypothetical protein [Tannerellaceae bacterium]
RRESGVLCVAGDAGGYYPVMLFYNGIPGVGKAGGVARRFFGSRMFCRSLSARREGWIPVCG